VFIGQFPSGGVLVDIKKQQKSPDSMRGLPLLAIPVLPARRPTLIFPPHFAVLDRKALETKWGR
jgi:hypothetical protein